MSRSRRSAIPGFQFIQDPLDYETRVHHSSIDTLDHLKADDLRQAAVIMASMLLSAANSDKELAAAAAADAAAGERSVQIRLSGAEISAEPLNSPEFT